MSGTGSRQISHRFMSEIGLLLLFLITDSFGSLYFFSLSSQKRSSYTVSQSKVQCSIKIVFHLVIIVVMLSCHVMSCYVTLPSTATIGTAHSQYCTFSMIPWDSSRLIFSLIFDFFATGTGLAWLCFGLEVELSPNSI